MNQSPSTSTPADRAVSPEPTPATPDSYRGFWSLFVVQFQGAFSDNVYRTLAMFLFVGMTLPFYNDTSRPFRMALVGALFALPFILFSMAGGYLADRFSKRVVAIGTKIAEVAIMLLATLALWWQEPVLLLATVFLMGAQSAFFGPTKYGLLSELLPERKLSWGNGVIELGTFLAIVAGTIGGGWLFEALTGKQVWAGVILIVLAVLGTVWSFGINRVPAADPAKKFRFNVFTDLGQQLRTISRDRVLTLAIVGNSYFFFLGALVQQYMIYSYGKDLLGLSEGQITAYLMSAIALGIGVGSYAAGRLSGNKIEYGLIPLGSLGMTLAGAYLALPDRGLAEVIVALALYGFFCGFFIVPVTALIQHRPASTERGATIATGNLLSFVGIFTAAGVFALFAGVLHLNPRQIFFVTTLLTIAGTTYALWLLPDAVLRFIMWVATHTIYRIKVLGRDNIPAKGGALFVCNHLSLADATLLQAAVDRPIRFIMLKAMYDKKFIGTWAKITGAIPISSELRPREMIKSLQTASDALKNGEIVCIFAEGQITRIGQMMPFRRGFERIMKDVDAPIIPVGLDGVWGSIFSFSDHKFLWKWPRRFPYPITINFGKAMPPTAQPVEVRQAVQELLAEAWEQRRAWMRPLHHQFAVTARRHPRRFAMVDAQTPAITFGGALVRSVLLARRLRQVWAGQEMVGLLLPPSVGGALANWAALFCGKVPVNLNYTLSEEAIASCAQQCQLKTILTSRAFIEKVKLKIPGEVLFLEDVAANPATSEKAVAWLMAKVLPVETLAHMLREPSSDSVEIFLDARGEGRGVGLDKLATVIFSSGSTGEPKGVMLSHYNIGSNIQQLGQNFAFGGKDKVLGALPFFHSFGFTGTLMLPGVLGIGAAYHANPLDAKTIGQLVHDHEVTFLLATPTFLQIYMRGCAAEQFGSVRLVAVGAEKLPDRLAAAFEEQFGVRPFEAYGCTECAPAVTVNTADFRAAGFRQVGAKRGKIGHPLPGICVRVVDPVHPDPNAPLPLGQSGLLLVRGPNVMRGYLGKPEKTAEVLRDGWYTTGDIAALDEDGFIQITDRLSRFSKIGGEMVPHIKVEERLHELAGATEQTFVVTSIADEKKGERLVVLHKLAEDKLKPVVEKLAASDLPNLWKPKVDSFVRLEVFPMLGTGKLDLRKVKEVAQQSSNPSGQE
jgi:acyl-[acyl-carrier-protein]-phospholipid O-acyltransferase/long-chain-fatty-acid--[acyl-carrier-protein] ligase